MPNSAKKKVRLLWVVHFHQPLGNFPEVFDAYTGRVCAPFLAALEKYPSVHCSLHFSGVLLEYLKKARGDVLDSIRALAARGQVELLGGGFYEPILSMIPREDAEWQLRKTIDWIQREFHTVPRGAWLPESVWEPHFVELLHRTGYQYATLEDSLFESVGWKRAQLFRAFSADFLNRRLLLFPSHRTWAHQLPHEGLREIKAAFTQLGNRPGPEMQIVTIAQNGDRYGLDPGTYEAAYEKGALEEWLRYLEGERQWIETNRLGDVPPQRWPAALLPPGAAESLEECALPSPAQRDFLGARGELAKRYDADRFLGYFRGGTWYGFIGKYAEAGLMHHKLLWLRDQVLQLPYCQEREEAMELLLAAEEHSVYWHARSGGIYANYLRDAVYQRLIQAERLLHSRDRDEAPKLIQTDYDGDSHDEVMLRSGAASIVVTPQYGGSVCEYSFWPTCFNLGNTFRRRIEAYHEAASAGSSAAPVEDWYERRLFQDHLVPANTTREAFAKNSFIEYGDFIDQPYEIVRTASGRDACTAVLERHGGLYINGERRTLTCRKIYQMEHPGRLTLDYVLTNQSDIPADVLFVCEVNYTCLSGDAPDRIFRWDGGEARCGDEFSPGKIAAWTIEDASRRFSWRWRVDGGAEVWHHPVHTLTFNQEKMEPHYQGSAFQLAWPLQLRPGAAAQFRVVCEAGSLE